MKRLYFVLLAGCPLLAYAQQPESTVERRLRRTETRTTTPALYPDRDTLVSMLKKRLNPVGSTELGKTYTADAIITDPSGKTLRPEEFRQQYSKHLVENHRLRNLRIEERTAQATETVLLREPGAAAPPKPSTIQTDLVKNADGLWLISRMRISNGK